MKKWIAAFLILVLALGMTGCGENKEAIKATTEAIDKIGEVTENSGTLIATADEMYSQLTDKEKELVANYSLLEEAQKEYQELMVLNSAKKAYQSIKDAANLTYSGLVDIYSAWSWGTTTKYFTVLFDRLYEMGEEKAKQNGDDYLTLYMGELLRKELPNIGIVDVSEFSDALKELGWTGKEFSNHSNRVHFVVYMYEKLGLIDDLDSRLDSASALLKEFDPSAAYYSDLKEYLALVNKRSELVKSPSGNLTQFSSTMMEFKDEVSECQAKVDIYLGD